MVHSWPDPHPSRSTTLSEVPDPDQGPTVADDPGAPTGAPETVEELVRTHLGEQLGGWRGGLEAALPTAAFAPVFVVTEDLWLSLGVGIGVAVALLGLRLAQRSETKHIRTGLIGIAIGAVLAATTGQGEDVFLPNIVFNLIWSAAIGLSVLVRWPLIGLVIGGVLEDPEAMKRDAGIMRLSDRLTLLLVAMGVIRAAVQVPLYLAGEVAWLGVSRVVLGWPLSAAMFAIAVAILAKGRTPLESPPGAL
jgi:hypothetical protein